MVLVGFGDDWMAIWRLPAMVGVVEVVGGRSPTAVPRSMPAGSYYSELLVLLSPNVPS